MTKKGRLLLIRREDPAQTGGVLPSPFKCVENGVGLGGDSPIFKIRHSVLLLAASLSLALAVLLFPFSGNGTPTAAALTPQTAAANDGFNDGIDRSDPNFVTASLLIMSPGDELYSCAGHACIRLECPTFNLDYCFSYESESVKEKVLTFFMGKLKMGMFAVPTADWLKRYEELGRGVTQYPLNLPPDAKQRLWKLLDDKVAEGPNLPYDHLKRGCAQSVLTILQEALKPYRLSVTSWPPQYKQTRREFAMNSIQHTHPWNLFFLQAICGAELDREVPNAQKVLLPDDLLALLREAKVTGRAVIDGEEDELLTAKPVKAPSVFTPIIASALFFAVAASNIFLKSTWIDVGFLVFQALLGAFFSYLVFLSNLPATSWHWLVMPFNLLPALFWKWRRKWALWFAAALVLWECGMIFYQHRLTDPAYLVLVAAFVLMYVRIGCPRWVSRHSIAQVVFGFGSDASTMRPPTV